MDKEQSLAHYHYPEWVQIHPKDENVDRLCADLFRFQGNPLENVSHIRDGMGVMVRGQ